VSAAIPIYPVAAKNACPDTAISPPFVKVAGSPATPDPSFSRVAAFAGVSRERSQIEYSVRPAFANRAPEEGPPRHATGMVAVAGPHRFWPSVGASE